MPITPSERDQLGGAIIRQADALQETIMGMQRTARSVLTGQPRDMEAAINHWQRELNEQAQNLDTLKELGRLMPAPPGSKPLKRGSKL